MTTINPPAGNASAVATLRAAVAANEEIHLARGMWIIDDQIDLAGICSKITADPEAVILLPENTKREGFLIRNLTKPLTFEPKKVISETTFKGQEAPFYIIDQGDVVIRGADISGIQYGHAFSLRRNKGGKNVEGTVIDGCTIQVRQIDERVPADERSTAIALNGHIEFETGYSTPNRQYSAIHRPPRVTTPVYKVTISNNTVTGGYYAIECSGVHGTVISDNTLRTNTRGISIQNGCVGVAARRNKIVDNISAAIHLAYGSAMNIIEFNDIRSTRAEGEGLLQAYVGSHSNIFRGNTIHMNREGDIRPKYALYAAVDSHSNVFEANYMEGSAKNALIGVESDWSNAINLAYHRSYRASADDNNLAGRDMSGIAVCRNVFNSPENQRVVLMSSVNGKKLSDLYFYGNIYPAKGIVDRIGAEGISNVFGL